MGYREGQQELSVPKGTFLLIFSRRSTASFSKRGGGGLIEKSGQPEFAETEAQVPFQVVEMSENVTASRKGRRERRMVWALIWFGSGIW